MKLILNWGVRGLVFTLVAILVVPLLIIQLQHIRDDRETDFAVMAMDVEQTGQIVSTRMETIINDAQQILSTLAHVPEIERLDTMAFQTIAVSLKSHFKDFANMGLVLADGTIIASQMPINTPIDASDRSWYKRVQAQRDFVIGDYQVGKITKIASMNFASPIGNTQGNGKLPSLFVAMDLRVIDTLLSQIKTEPGASIVVVDSKGTILSRFPEAAKWRGLRQPDIRESVGSGDIVKGKGIDGKERLYRYTVIPNTHGQLKVLVGYSPEQLEQKSNLKLFWGILSLLIVIGVTISFSFWLSHRKLVLPLLQMQQGAQRIEKGDFEVAIHVKNSLQEITQLSDAFNTMAFSLKRNIELTQVWMDTIPNPLYRKSKFGVYLACNNAFAEFWGKPKEQILGKTILDLNTTHFAQLIQTADEKVLSNLKVQTHEVEFIRSDGSKVTLLTSKAPYFDRDGLVEGIVGGFVDISERKIHEEQTLKMNMDLERLVQEKTGSLEVVNQKLREAQSMLQLVLNSIPSRVFWKDVQSRYLGCNLQFAQDAGIESPEMIIGKYDDDLLWGAQAKLYQEGDRKVIQDGRALIRFEETVQIPGKNAMTVLTSKIPLHDSQGRLIGILGVFDDISSRKEMEESIRKSERFMHTITDHIPGLLAYWTKDLRCAFANAAYLEWFGKTSDQMLDIQMQDLLGPEHFAKNLPHIESCLAGTHVAFERKLTKVNGEIRYTWAQYLPDMVNSVVKGFTVLVTDITDVKKAQEELAELTSRMSLATKVGGVGVWEYDVVNNKLLWDEQMFALYGLKSSDFGGAYEAWVEGVHPEDRERGNREIQLALQGAQDFNTEFRVRWPDKSTHNIRAMGNVIRDSSGAPLKMIGTNWDITKQKQTEEEIRSINKYLEEATARANDMAAKAELATLAKSEFLANMSHEIRTPMNAVLGFAEILANQITVPKQKRYLESIQASGKTLLTLINDILDLSKIEAGKMEIHVAPVDIRALLLEMESIFKQRCDEKKILLSLVNSSNVPRSVMLDGVRLRQILFNLVGNAVKFTNQGNITFGVEIPGDTSRDLEIFVQDSGIGIRKNQLNVIFEPFRQQEGQVHAIYGGTGLGLAISQRLAKIMNGEIHVQSEWGKGSRFTLRLSDVKWMKNAEDMQTENRNQLDEISFHDCRILAADDTIHNRELLQAMLDLPDVTVKTVCNGIELLEALKQEPYDLIIMDIRMPEMDGITTLEMLKADSSVSTIPVIAVTASVYSDAETKMKEVGFDGYLSKPFVRADLLHLIEELLPHKSKKMKLSDSKNALYHPELRVHCKPIPELIQILRNEVVPICERLESKLVISQVRELATRVDALAKQYADDALEAWVSSLRTAVDSFDTVVIAQDLKRFAKLIPIA